MVRLLLSEPEGCQQDVHVGGLELRRSKMQTKCYLELLVLFVDLGVLAISCQLVEAC